MTDDLYRPLHATPEPASVRRVAAVPLYLTMCPVGDWDAVQPEDHQAQMRCVPYLHLAPTPPLAPAPPPPGGWSLLGLIRLLVLCGTIIGLVLLIKVPSAGMALSVLVATLGTGLLWSPSR